MTPGYWKLTQRVLSQGYLHSGLQTGGFVLQNKGIISYTIESCKKGGWVIPSITGAHSLWKAMSECDLIFQP